MKPLKFQHGFADVILIVIVAILVAGLGGYVYYRQQQANKTYNAAGNGVVVATNTKKPAAKTTTSATTSTATQALPLVLDCPNDSSHQPSIKPTGLELTCADAGTNAENLAWSTWTQTAAAATGDVKAHICQPDCASSTTYKTFSASFALSGLKTVSDKTYFQTLTVTYSGANPDGKNPETFTMAMP